MSRVRVESFSVSLDGCGAGQAQSLEHPLGVCGKDVRIGGGVATIRQALQARLIDDIHLAMAPVLLGSGEPLFAGLDLPALGYAMVERVATPRATRLVLTRPSGRTPHGPNTERGGPLGGPQPGQGPRAGRPAVALTSQEPRAGYPLTLELTSARLPKRSGVKTSQVRTLSTERIGRRLGRASDEEVATVIDGLMEIVG